MPIADKMIPIAIDQLADRIFQDNRRQGFWDGRHRKLDSHTEQSSHDRLVRAEMIALMHSELSEMIEDLRKGNREATSTKIEGFTREEEELADLIIRALDYAGGFRLRIGEAIDTKLEHNRTRPRLHGKQA